MKCDICGTDEAVIHIQQVSGDEEIHLHLCEECAALKGVTAAAESTEDGVSHLLNGLLDIDDTVSRLKARKNCPGCGMSLKEFKAAARLGCNECYTAFAAEIRSVIRQAYGNVTHKGKFPRRVRTYKTYLMDMQSLKRKLSRAVKEENYEEAAQLRDRIDELKSLKR